ncbi:MAG: hypothetical protein ABFD08_17780 [Syntrophomonas sp.]
MKKEKVLAAGRKVFMHLHSLGRWRCRWWLWPVSVLLLWMVANISGIAAAQDWPVIHRDVEKNHVWNIKFNTEVDPFTVNESNIYVKDDNGVTMGNVSFTVIDNGKTVQVWPPGGEYEAGASYYLYIGSGLKSKSGQNLGSDICMGFSIESDDPTPLVIMSVDQITDSGDRAYQVIMNRSVQLYPVPQAEFVCSATNEVVEAEVDQDYYGGWDRSIKVIPEKSLSCGKWTLNLESIFSKTNEKPEDLSCEFNVIPDLQSFHIASTGLCNNQLRVGLDRQPADIPAADNFVITRHIASGSSESNEVVEPEAYYWNGDELEAVVTMPQISFPSDAKFYYYEVALAGQPGAGISTAPQDAPASDSPTVSIEGSTRLPCIGSATSLVADEPGVWISSDENIAVVVSSADGKRATVVGKNSGNAAISFTGFASLKQSSPVSIAVRDSAGTTVSNTEQEDVTYTVDDPDVEWVKAFNGVNQADEDIWLTPDPSAKAKRGIGYTVFPAKDGGFMVAGAVKPSGSSYNDIYLLKTDAWGNKQWDNHYGGDGSQWLDSINETSDGGYILVGTSEVNNDRNVFMVKTDSRGAEMWRRTFGGAQADYGHSIVNTSDGGYCLVCASFSFTQGNNGARSNAYLIKTDSSGNEEWSRLIGGSGSINQGNTLFTDRDGGFLIGGCTNSFNQGDWEMYIIKTDSSGQVVWQEVLGGANDDSGFVMSAADGCFVTGSTRSYSSNSTSYGVPELDSYLAKLDNNGSPLWQSIIAVDGDNKLGVRKAIDGGFLLYCNTNSSGQSIIIKLNSSGQKEWEKLFPLADICSLSQMTDGSIILTANQAVGDQGESRIYLVKLDSALTPSQSSLSTVIDPAFTHVRKVSTTGGEVLEGAVSSDLYTISFPQTDENSIPLVNFMNSDFIVDSFQAELKEDGWHVTMKIFNRGYADGVLEVHDADGQVVFTGMQMPRIILGTRHESGLFAKWWQDMDEWGQGLYDEYPWWDERDSFNPEARGVIFSNIIVPPGGSIVLTKKGDWAFLYNATTVAFECLNRMGVDGLSPSDAASKTIVANLRNSGLLFTFTNLLAGQNYDVMTVAENLVAAIANAFVEGGAELISSSVEAGTLDLAMDTLSNLSFVGAAKNVLEWGNSITNIAGQIFDLIHAQNKETRITMDAPEQGFDSYSDAFFRGKGISKDAWGDEVVSKVGSPGINFDIGSKADERIWYYPGYELMMYNNRVNSRWVD